MSVPNRHREARYDRTHRDRNRAGRHVLYVWGMVSWMVLPWHNATLNERPNEAAARTLIAPTIGGKPDVYYFPKMPTDWNDQEAMNAYRKVHEQGPVGFIFAQPGRPVMPPSTFAVGVATNLASALLASLLLAAASASLRSYPARVIFVAGLGVLIAVTTHVPLWNWMHFPTDYSIVMFLDSIAAFVLAGIVIAAVVKRRAPAASESGEPPA